MGRGFSIGTGENRDPPYERAYRAHATRALQACDLRDRLPRADRHQVPEEAYGIRGAPIGKAPYHPRWAIMQLCITLALWTVVAVGVKLAITWL
jgi:hypothetical protein